MKEIISSNVIIRKRFSMKKMLKKKEIAPRQSLSWKVKIPSDISFRFKCLIFWLDQLLPEVAFRPMIPIKMKATNNNLRRLRGSPNNTIPSSTAPAAPIPVQMA